VAHQFKVINEPINKFMKLIPLIGRVFFSLIFLQTAFNHFSKETISYAASQNVPLASLLVPASGILAIIGGASIVLGYKARLGAWLIVLFLVPVTIMMHNFWTLTDPMMRQMQMAMFMKNISMLGGALLITYFGSGPLSIDTQK
jgi:putative oxidoreductase